MDRSVREIMQGFARRTGLESGGLPPKRYLWTDAFAVCNFLGDFAETGDQESLRLALRLVDETHRVLGRHRSDDDRHGWISGLDDEKGASHPTAGGLRIGKERPERRPGETFDSAIEWERDGQYFHYLTKWMHALDSVSKVIDDPKYRRWAVELARSAYAAFVIADSTGVPIGLHWKMSIDLTRPLVPASGQHDALDALVIYSRLQGGPEASDECDLSREIREMARLCSGQSWFTDDALGIGGLLMNAHYLARMMAEGIMSDPPLLRALIEASASGVVALVRSRAFDAPAESRLAFRELGLSIGLRAVGRIEAHVRSSPAVFENVESLPSLLKAFAPLEELASRIEEFWCEAVNQRASSWTGHREINEVMLATSLAPYGFLDI